MEKEFFFLSIRAANKTESDIFSTLVHIEIFTESYLSYILVVKEYIPSFCSLIM